MLKVISYQHYAKLDEALKTKIGSNLALLVTSNPLKADSLRLRWAAQSNVDVITFAKFSSLISESLKLGNDKVAWRKSKLLLQLNAFKNLLPNGEKLKYSEFKAAYQIFSDLRAYVPTQDFPDEILSHFDDNIALQSQLFHKAARNLDILDEHTGTLFLAEELRKPEAISLDRAIIVFEGFSFLTPVQISLVEALAIRHQVIIPVPDYVLENAHPFDWVSIIKDSADELTKIEDKSAIGRKLSIKTYPSGSLQTCLKEKFKAENTSTQIYLSSKKLDPVIEQMIPLESYTKKQQVDILLEERDLIVQQLEEKCLIERNLKKAEEIFKVIDEMLSHLKETKNLESAKSIAVLLLIKKSLNSLPKILDNQKMDFFFFQLLREVIALDSPRNNIISMLPLPPENEVLSLGDLHLLNSQKKCLFCIDGMFGNIMSGSRAFSPKLESELAKLGPVRRPELEFLFLQANLMDLWSHQDLEVWLEEGLLNHDVGWKKIFANFNLEISKISFKETIPIADFSFLQSKLVPQELKRISASRLQDYLDCPKKYHASRVEKITPLVKQISEVDVMNLGNVEHELIKIGWERGENFWSEIQNLEYEAKRLLIENYNFDELNPIALAGAAHEASLYSLNGIQRLKQLVDSLSDAKVIFAQALNSSTERQGEIDCLITSKNLELIIDFKRSKGSNPSSRQFFQDFSKIQLWFYLNSIPMRPDGGYGVGYLFLKDIQDSWLAIPETFKDSLSAHFDGKVVEWENFNEQIEKYRAFEREAIERLKSEKDFSPNPSSAKICTFCDLNSICNRSGFSDEEEL